MEKNSKIYIAGHTGLVGSAITRNLIAKGYNNLIFRTQLELDLTDQRAVHDFFEVEKPEYVFLAAALVGGIVANNTYRADFIYQNIMIQSNVIHACWQYEVKKLLFLGSTCIYPKNAPQPLKEEYLLTSPLEYTNEPYAIAKIAGLKMCESFNIQYGTDFIAVMPTNLYGPGDNYNLEKSHVLPALMRKMHLGRCLEDQNWDGIRKDLARYPVEGIDGNAENIVILEILRKYGVTGDNGNVKVSIWGTGTPMREFMHSDDMAGACVFIMERVKVKDILNLNAPETMETTHKPHFLNVGAGEEISIKELAYRIKKVVGFEGELVFDSSKPDGTMRKISDTTLLRHLGYNSIINLNYGLNLTYAEYCELVK